MREIRDVAGTAFVVAEWRADGSRQPDALYRDHLAEHFLDDATRSTADSIAAISPPLIQGVWLRTRYIDDRLRAAIAGGVRQVVILGAGLDTRAVRVGGADVEYFEIDQAEILEFKRSRLTERGITWTAHAAPGDYVRSGIGPLLRGTRFEPDRPSHVIWEGNTEYLSAASVTGVLRDVADSFSSFSLTFDIMSEALIRQTTGSAELTGVVERFRALGAPWTYGRDDLAALAAEAEAEVADQVTTAELHRRHWPDRPLHSPFFDHYALCTIRSVE